jgi:NAD dependent epimerase/dehydratase family enzyme
MIRRGIHVATHTAGGGGKLVRMARRRNERRVQMLTRRCRSRNQKKMPHKKNLRNSIRDKTQEQYSTHEARVNLVGMTQIHERLHFTYGFKEYNRFA